MAFQNPVVKIAENDGNAVLVTAENTVLAVSLDGNAVFEDNGFLMLPGESRRIGYRKRFPDEPDEIVVHGLFQEEA